MRVIELKIALISYNVEEIEICLKAINDGLSVTIGCMEKFNLAGKHNLNKLLNEISDLFKKNYIFKEGLMRFFLLYE